MFLTQAELHELTGYKPNQHKKQTKFLRERGYKFDLDAYGRPRVLVSYVEAILGASTGKVRKKFEPDFSELDNVRRIA